MAEPLMTIKVGEDEMNVFQFEGYHQSWRPQNSWGYQVDRDSWNRHTPEEKEEIYQKHLARHITKTRQMVKVFMKYHNGKERGR